MITDKQITAPAETPGFITTEQFLQRVPISRRTLATWRMEGKIPFVNVTGRRILFHWPSVEAAMLRNQKGGAE
jgi:predicted site-specific integrase-resolvase